jgi:hypothetical protein
MRVMFEIVNMHLIILKSKLFFNFENFNLNLKFFIMIFLMNFNFLQVYYVI